MAALIPRLCTNLDIAVPGFCSCRDDAHRNHFAVGSVISGNSDSFSERGDIDDCMVGSHHHHDGVIAALYDGQGCAGERWCRVAPNWLQDDPAGATDAPQLLCGQEPMVLSADHENLLSDRPTSVERVEATRRCL